MAIGVYRIYVSRAWTGAPAFGRLVTALDALPTFLYRIDRIGEAELAAAASAPESLPEAARIAMTQSHIALVDPASLDDADGLAKLEIELAQRSFRRRIPVLGVIVPGPDAVNSAGNPTGIDRIVRLEIQELLIAIQDLAEQAAAERRAINERLLGQPLRLIASPTVNFPAQSPETPAADAVRTLPIAAILASLAELKAAREQDDRPH